MPSPPKPTVPPEWGLRISEDEPLEQFRIQVHGALHGRAYERARSVYHFASAYERARSVYHFARVEDDNPSMPRFLRQGTPCLLSETSVWEHWRFYALLLLQLDPLLVHATGHRVVTRTRALTCHAEESCPQHVV